MTTKSKKQPFPGELKEQLINCLKNLQLKDGASRKERDKTVDILSNNDITIPNTQDDRFNACLVLMKLIMFSPKAQNDYNKRFVAEFGEVIDQLAKEQKIAPKTRK